jgi:hypothetical protein
VPAQDRELVRARVLERETEQAVEVSQVYESEPVESLEQARVSERELGPGDSAEETVAMGGLAEPQP